jgi:phosphohistidine phosphatase
MTVKSTRGSKPTRSLYLIRHAIAAERGEKWPDDDVRPLTPEGVSRMRRAAAGAAALEMELDIVLASPLVRAQDTAAILARALRPHPPVATLPELAPGHPPARIAAALANLADVTGVALVGHEPGLGELAAWLLGAKRSLPFKKGAICRIDIAEWPPRQGTLVWFATPRLLRGLRHRHHHH